MENNKYKGHIKFIGYAISELSYIEKLDVLSKSMIEVMIEDGVPKNNIEYSITLGKYRTTLDFRIDRGDGMLEQYLK